MMVKKKKKKIPFPYSEIFNWKHLIRSEVIFINALSVYFEITQYIMFS